MLTLYKESNGWIVLLLLFLPFCGGGKIWVSSLYGSCQLIKYQFEISTSIKLLRFTIIHDYIAN